MNLLFHAATSSELLQQWSHKTEIPSVIHLFDELREALSKWYALGIVLGIRPSTLESIQVDHQTSILCLIEMLQVWLKTSPQPTWETIVEALKDPTVGNNRLAAKIEAKYCRGKILS